MTFKSEGSNWPLIIAITKGKTKILFFLTKKFRRENINYYLFFGELFDHYYEVHFHPNFQKTPDHQEQV